MLDTNVRQLPSYGGSAETALADVQRYLENDFRVVVFASDERRADVLAAMLEHNGIPPLRGFPERRSAAGGTRYGRGGRALRGS